jgi:hypothetical protein
MPVCRNCGEHVTVQFARVFGDNQDRVRKCIACVPNAELDELSNDENEDKAIDQWVASSWR